MRILFCDDDPEILTRLQEYVAEYFDRIEIELPECAAYDSGESLLQCENRADIAFLDVEMLGISGIRAGAELTKRNPEIKILVVTSYPDYLDEAMRFQVFRYLSKPIDKNRLFRNLKDALYQYNMATQQYAIPLENGVDLVLAKSDNEVRMSLDVVLPFSETMYLNPMQAKDDLSLSIIEGLCEVMQETTDVEGSKLIHL